MAVQPGLGGLLSELEWRGILHATTPGLPARLATGRTIAGYNGFDPSGPSLHIGHLVPIMGLLRFQQHGGKPVALVGGGTGMIGDPSGTSAERNLLDRATLEANVAGIRAQLERFLDFTPSAGERGAVLVNNLDWLGEIGLIEWLRDVGKHFTIPYMLAKDSVQTRLDRGLSFTEFSYMLIQATDFEHLYRTMGVELQMGGADQWGNITAGLELIRRRAGLAGDAEAAGGEEDGHEAPAHGLAYRLLLSPSGAKFGKTADGTSVWLDAERTSPFAFYQYWLNVDDRDAGTYLRWFTLLSREEIEALERATAERPEAREAQRALAHDVTARTHGAAAAAHAEVVSAAAFSREPITDPAVLATLHDSVNGFTFSAADRAGGPLEIALRSGLFESAGEARRAIAQGGLTIGDDRVTGLDAPVPEPVAGEWLLVRAGKRRLAVGRLAR
jgi:tyrosyl-tRNA synthetase